MKNDLILVSLINQRLAGEEISNLEIGEEISNLKIDISIIENVAEKIEERELIAIDVVNNLIIEVVIKNSDGKITTPKEAQEKIDDAKNLEAKELADIVFLTVNLGNIDNKVNSKLSSSRAENIQQMINEKTMLLQLAREELANHLKSNNNPSAENLRTNGPNGWLREDDIKYLLNQLNLNHGPDGTKYIKPLSVLELNKLPEKKYKKYYPAGKDFPGMYIKPRTNELVDGELKSIPMSLVPEEGGFIEYENQEVIVLDNPDSTSYLDAAEWNTGNQAFVIINTGRTHYRLVLNPNNKEMKKVIDIYKQLGIPEDSYNNDIKTHFTNRGMENYMPQIVSDGNCGVDCAVTIANLFGCLTPEFALQKTGVDNKSAVILQNSSLLSPDLWKDEAKAFAFVKSSNTDCEYSLVINQTKPEIMKKDVQDILIPLSKLYKENQFDKSGNKAEVKNELLKQNIPGIVPIFEFNSNSDTMYSIVVDTALKINPLPVVQSVSSPSVAQTVSAPPVVPITVPPITVPITVPPQAAPQVVTIVPPAQKNVSVKKTLAEIYAKTTPSINLSELSSKPLAAQSTAKISNFTKNQGSLSLSGLKPTNNVNLAKAYGNPTIKTVPQESIGYTEEERNRAKISYEIRLQEENKNEMAPRPSGLKTVEKNSDASSSNIKKNNVQEITMVGNTATFRKN